MHFSFLEPTVNHYSSSRETVPQRYIRFIDWGTFYDYKHAGDSGFAL